jgi:hypothetical protein
MSGPIRRNAAVFLFCSRNMKEFPIWGGNGGMFYLWRPADFLSLILP